MQAAIPTLQNFLAIPCSPYSKEKQPRAFPNWLAFAPAVRALQGRLEKGCSKVFLMWLMVSVVWKEASLLFLGCTDLGNSVLVCVRRETHCAQQSFVVIYTV